MSRNPGGFQTVWLNIYGWSALVGTGLALGAPIGLLTPLPLWIALVVGVLAVWGALLVLDHRRYLNSTVHLVDDRLDPETGAAVVARLAKLGVSAAYEEYDDEDEEGTYVQRGILCRQADVEGARRVLSGLLS